jgi:hypothetical protein
MIEAVAAHIGGARPRVAGMLMHRGEGQAGFPGQNGFGPLP